MGSDESGRPAYVLCERRFTVDSAGVGREMQFQLLIQVHFRLLEDWGLLVHDVDLNSAQVDSEISLAHSQE